MIARTAWWLVAPVAVWTLLAQPVMAASEFGTLAERFLADRFTRHPSWATAVGLHRHDHELADFSFAAARAEEVALQRFQRAFEAIPLARLSATERADRVLIEGTIAGQLSTLRVDRPLANDPDSYSSGITEAAFSLITRDFAPAPTRLRALLARMRRMPAVLETARYNLGRPPRVFTEIALDQMAGNKACFATTLREAFAGVKDPGLQRSLAARSRNVLAALTRYETFLRHDILPRSDGNFALGATRYRQKWLADEQIDLPLDQLLAIGHADLARNQQAFRDTAALIDPLHSPTEVLASLAKDHLQAGQVLPATQAMLDELKSFCVAKQLLTLPPASPLRVVETPPFMRATTSAAMDTPGAYEAGRTMSYYYMTLPNPKWPAAEREDFLSQLYRAGIANTSVHEAYPGHYVQFLFMPRFPSMVRKVLYASSTAEGWAHYCEQMVLDEGYQDGDPRYRLAMLQDALLRDARLIVGIKLHTGGLTVAEATAFFEREAYMPFQAAKSEAWRGTGDSTYGYYTLGKLMILKLREDYRLAKGPAYTLRGFHDAFLSQGSIPLPLIREALLGQRGELL